MEFKDYYKTLGVQRTATPDDIKRSYRKLARKYHPDVSKEPNAEEHFKAVQEAYEVLKDPKKREAYDQLGSDWRSGQEFRPPPDLQQSAHFSDINSEDFSDFFSSLFGKRSHQGGGFRARHAEFRQRGQDEHAKINISLEEAYQGATKNIRLITHEQDEHGHVHAKPHTLKVTIPKSVLSGQQLRLAHQGSPGMGGAPAGDLYLEINLEPHPIFTLQDRDVYLTLPITPWEAALGAKITIPTLGGNVEMKIAPNSQAGQKLRLKNRGLSGKTAIGDQYVLLQIVTPLAHTESERALYEKMAQEMPLDPRKDLLRRV